MKTRCLGPRNYNPYKSTTTVNKFLNAGFHKKRIKHVSYGRSEKSLNNAASTFTIFRPTNKYLNSFTFTTYGSFTNNQSLFNYTCFLKLLDVKTSFLRLHDAQIASSG